MFSVILMYLSYLQQLLLHIPANIYLLKLSNRNTRNRCEICAKLTVKTPELYQLRHSGFFIVNFEHILHFFLVFLLLTLKRQMFAGLLQDTGEH